MSTPSPPSPAVRAGTAMAAYAAVHSALASTWAKDAAARLVGARARDVGYRPFYLAQSAVATWALLRYVRALPERVLAVSPPPVAAALRAAHVGATGLGVWALVSAGVGRVSGLDNVAAGALGRPARPTPPAHGPYEGAVAGPFRRSRHPLNLAFLVTLWPARRLTSRRLGAALVGTAYVFAGSAMEERRNQAAYGTAYEGYRRRVPFFWPRVRPAR